MNNQKAEIDRLTQEVRDLQSLAYGMQDAADSLRAERDAAVAHKIVAVAEEREACAAVCEGFDTCDPQYIAESIRARVKA